MATGMTIVAGMSVHLTNMTIVTVKCIISSMLTMFPSMLLSRWYMFQNLGCLA